MKKTRTFTVNQNLTLVQLNPMYHIKGKKKLELNKAEKEELFTKLQNKSLVMFKKLTKLLLTN